MHKLMMIAAFAALSACSRQDPPPTEDVNIVADADTNLDANAAAANMAVPAALTTLNETTWEFTDPETKKPMRESIDAKGNYITVSGSEHIDHGTAVMKDGKACFTSAMTKDGEECWKDPILAIGQSGESVSDKGEKLTVKRVAYVPLTM